MNFEDTINLILSMSVHSIPGELRDYFESVSKIPSKSALIQQRQKIAPEAFSEIFDEFTGSFNLKKTFRGYMLLAVDGTSVSRCVYRKKAIIHLREFLEKEGYTKYA